MQLGTVHTAQSFEAAILYSVVGHASVQRGITEFFRRSPAQGPSHSSAVTPVQAVHVS